MRGPPFTHISAHKRGTAEMITIACAMGYSSVKLRSICGDIPAGVISSRVCHGPAGQGHGGFAAALINDAHVAPEDTAAQARAQRLGTGFLCGKPLGVAGRPGRPAFRPLLFSLSEDPLHEAVAEAFQRLLDPSDVDQIAADAEDH